MCTRFLLVRDRGKCSTLRWNTQEHQFTCLTRFLSVRAYEDYLMIRMYTQETNFTCSTRVLVVRACDESQALVLSAFLLQPQTRPDVSGVEFNW